MKNKLDFERWSPPVLHGEVLANLNEQRKKKKRINFAAGIVSLNIVLFMIFTMHISMRGMESARIGICSMGICLCIYMIVISQIIFKRRDYFYD